MKRRLYIPTATLLALPLGCAGEVTPDIQSRQQAAEVDPNCEALTYEAEDMFQSVGGETEGGWNIWSNGYISTVHDFEGGTTVMTAVVRGDFAGGAAPNMVVTVAGEQVHATAVGSSSWTEYSFTFEAEAGEQEIRIYFTNDYYQNGQDRNLYVDKLVVGCGVGLCGNGVVNSNEECDDGNQDDGDGCSNECTLPPPENTDWVPLTLKNGWVQEANSNEPAVKLINGIVTFRGGLDGTAATGNIAFCLTDDTVGPIDYSDFRPTDGGLLPLRAALHAGSQGTLGLDFPFNPEVPQEQWYCMGVYQDFQSSTPGEDPGDLLDAEVLTSLEGVAFDRTYADSVWLQPSIDWASSFPYPLRGNDSVQNPGGQGVFAKLVDGFVRFQGAVDGGMALGSIFTLPAGQGLWPDETVYLPVTLDGRGARQLGQIAVHPNGNVEVEGNAAAAGQSVTVDGASFSVSSPAGAQAITLDNGWAAESARAVRARIDSGMVRLEGAVEGGTTEVIGTLPEEMWPSKTLYLASNALLFAQRAVLSVDPTGVITVVGTPLVVADQGISLDGVSFALGGDGFECLGACEGATPLSRYENSGAFGSGERWFVVSQDINGWQGSQMPGRTITVNGVTMTAGEMPLPAKVDGVYYFQFSAGDFSWASWSFW